MEHKYNVGDQVVIDVHMVSNPVYQGRIFTIRSQTQFKGGPGYWIFDDVDDFPAYEAVLLPYEPLTPEYNLKSLFDGGFKEYG